MTRLFCMLTFGILVAGCDNPTVTTTKSKSPPKADSSNLLNKDGLSQPDEKSVVKTSSSSVPKKDGLLKNDIKTVQQARDECQSRIDRYFGGQRGNDLLGFSFSIAEAGRGTKANEIQILRIIAEYDEQGKPRPNSFVGTLRCSANRLTGIPDNQDFNFKLIWLDGNWKMH